MGGDGTLIRDWNQLQSYFISRFKSLFTNSQAGFPSNLDDLVQPGITSYENEVMCSVPSNVEIWNAHV